MTMQELSPQYARQAEAVSRRLRELRHQALTEGDPERVQALRRRQQELRPGGGKVHNRSCFHEYSVFPFPQAGPDVCVR